MNRAALAAAFDATADELADVAYNRMQKSEEANAMFDRAQEYRRAAKWLSDHAAGSSDQCIAIRLGALEIVGCFA